MAIHRILLEPCVGETRAVALDENDLPVALWLDRWSDADTRPRVGDVRAARIRKFEPSQGGGFAELADGAGEAFVRIPAGLGITEGQAVQLRIEAEAHEDKLPRAAIVTDAALSRAGFETWIKRLPGGETAPVETVQPGSAEVDAAFEDVLVPHAQIPGGGRLRVERAAALTAADIDTSGRISRGSAASRALQVNSAAATELARQCSLRGLGGLVVLDCIAPLNLESGRKVQTAFLTAWRKLSHRTVKAEPPSVFGLMEASLAWGETPMAERLLDASGALSAETQCLAGLRSLQKALGHNTMDRLTLRLPTAAHAWMTASGLDLTGALAEKHANRFEITGAEIPKPEVA